MTVLERPMPVRAVTRGPGHHFFGYYDHRQWDATGRWLLALEVGFDDRPPMPDDAATIGVIDTEQDCHFRPMAQTCAWCWQQGSMLEWLSSSPDDPLFVHNDRDGDRYVSVVRDLAGKAQQTLPLPVYSVSTDGKQAVTLNFARLAHTRPGYGYVGVEDRWEDQLAPEEDGIYWMDVGTGEHDLIIRLGQVTRFEPRSDMAGAVHWFNHLLFSPDGRRFAFLHRWRQPGAYGRKQRVRASWCGALAKGLWRAAKRLAGVRRLVAHYGATRTRLFTAKPDGTGLCLLADDDMVSHFIWRDDRHILAWARRRSEGDHYYLFSDEAEDVEIVAGDLLDCDGHCSYSPDKRWILTDTYPSARDVRTLVLFDTRTHTRRNVGDFHSPPELAGEIRCDLHPRWKPDGTAVSIDSAHEGSRQVYVVDVSSLVTE